MTLSDRILLPIANETDAERTCAAVVEQFGSEPDLPSIVVTHVIEKDGGVPESEPLSAEERAAESIFTLAETTLEAEGFEVDTARIYGTDVITELADVAEKLGVTSIVFLPRPQGGLLSQIFSEQLSTELLFRSQVPVVVLPQPDD